MLDALPRRQLRVVELFAGVGGLRVALERSGWKVIWANQWEPSTTVQRAFACYSSHFSAGEHVNADLHAVLDEVDAGQRLIPDHELLVGGFPCFAAGTMVLTATGHKSIEDVRVGEHVLTHLGRWRRVTGVMSRVTDATVHLHGQGFPDVVTTPEHPFWARRRSHRWDDDLRRDVRAFEVPSWVAAGEMTRDTFLSQVYPLEHPEPSVDIDRSEDFYWIVGRYLADGWRFSAGRKGRVVICAAPKESAELEERIRRVYTCTRVSERTVVKFHITRSDLYHWLDEFGTRAAGKRIPGWLYALDQARARSLLEGYASGDGSPSQCRWRSTTASRALALGLALLAQRAYGVVASIDEAEVAPSTVIEGRRIKQLKQYTLVIPSRDRSAFVDGFHGWKKVHRSTTGGPMTVYNLAVDEDESYTADGCVVHNCQDYSVAKTLNQAAGIEGKKGVLWWEIHRLLTLKRPPYLLLENVDRLLKSPARQRGRDFAVMLATLSDLGYEVEWRIVNAADYGLPQKRRRVFIMGRLAGEQPRDPDEVIQRGVLGRALRIRPVSVIPPEGHFTIAGHPAEVSDGFGARKGASPFRNAGYMSHRLVWTVDVQADWTGPRQTLGDILEDSSDVPESYFVPAEELPRWQYLKGAKREQRVHRGSDTPYFYVEGPIPYPDPTDQPARTILTGEGGRTPSRFKHLIRAEDGRFRRLTPRELERLNGFPDDWTATGMTDGQRAFMMGNALVVGIVERVGRELMEEVRAASSAQNGGHMQST